MLARSFLTADQLRLTADQHNALILTLHALERGELRYVEPKTLSCEGDKFTGEFNIHFWNCESVCCIGGTAELLGGLRHRELMIKAACGNRELHKLFYPMDDHTLEVFFHPASTGGLPHLMMNITPEHAAVALANYLTTGHAKWGKVLSSK